jgi:Rrf2 family protein
MMTVLGFHHGEEMKSCTLAQSVQADPTFIRRALSKLVKAGLVETTRGRHGSCILARAPERITLLDIYRASEAPPTFAIHDYPVEEGCPTSKFIKPALTALLADYQRKFEQNLARTTLADVIAEIRRRCR